MEEIYIINKMKRPVASGPPAASGGPSGVQGCCFLWCCAGCFQFSLSQSSCGIWLLCCVFQSPFLGFWWYDLRPLVGFWLYFQSPLWGFGLCVLSPPCGVLGPVVWAVPRCLISLVPGFVSVWIVFQLLYFHQKKKKHNDPLIPLSLSFRV